jgi:hypothetical protein
MYVIWLIYTAQALQAVLRSGWSFGTAPPTFPIFTFIGYVVKS